MNRDRLEIILGIAIMFASLAATIIIPCAAMIGLAAVIGAF